MSDDDVVVVCEGVPDSVAVAVRDAMRDEGIEARIVFAKRVAPGSTPTVVYVQRIDFERASAIAQEIIGAHRRPEPAYATNRAIAFVGTAIVLSSLLVLGMMTGTINWVVGCVLLGFIILLAVLPKLASMRPR